MGVAARRGYAKAFDEFVEWQRLLGRRQPSDLNGGVTEVLMCMDHLLQEELPAHRAELTVAAVADALPVLAALPKETRIRRALRGFRKARPPRSRAPIAKELMAAAANILIQRGQLQIAQMVVLMFFSYCRPGEIRGLKRKQLLRPVRRRGPMSHWSLHLAPAVSGPEVQALTKTGIMDDCVVMDKPPWIGRVVELLRSKVKDNESRVFSVPDGHTVFHFKEAGKILGVPDWCLYQLRHGGASEDVLDGSRSVDLVKQRGRWTTDGSVRRYSKPAQLQKLLGSLSAPKLQHAIEAWDALEDLLCGRRPGWLPAS